MTNQYRGINSLVNPVDDKPWMFYSFNDGVNVGLVGTSYIWQTPLKREERRFETIRSIEGEPQPTWEWNATIYPEFLADIDGDGRLELVCRMLVGYSTSPRGIAVYDFETGEVKWRFDMPCIVHSLLYGDFDNDGKTEFIVGTISYKNTSKIINGFDDSSGYLAVIDTSGELLYQEQLFEGFGSVNLSRLPYRETQDKAIYATISTDERKKRNSVTKLSWDGKRLQKHESWDLGTYFDPRGQPYQFHNMDGSRKWRLFLADKSKGLIVLDEDLKPIPHDYQGFIKSICAVGDLDQDGFSEIVVYTADKHIEILDHNLKVRASLPSPIMGDEAVRLHLAETGFDSPMLVAAISGNQVFYYSYNQLSAFVIFRNWVQAYHWLITLILALFAISSLSFILYTQLQFRSLSRGLGLSVILVDKKGRIRLASKRAKELFASYSSGAYLRNIKEVEPKLLQILQVLFKGTDKHYESELQIEAQGKRQLFRVQIFKTPGPRKRAMVILTYAPEDATLEKIAWADTARRLSHHVRRHITNVILVLPLLEKDDLEAGQKEEYLQIIRDEIEKVRVFTHSFQRFTELKNYDLKLQDIAPSLEHVISHLRLPENITLIKNWTLKSVHAFIEPIRFEEALINLINNAVEAMPDGGTLHISLKSFPNHSSPKGPLSVLVEIEDNGIGIPEKYLDEIFNPFFTTNQSGTGIGIPESRKIIESMGGEIHIQSEEGVGTVVSLWLKGESDGKD
ncbi:MAG: hypothetical protein LHW44_03425 [Candidatus Cloacimonetes bacterium]|nr:hypothetical protein [Candidatus Cloacimonadota bacterium]